MKPAMNFDNSYRQLPSHFFYEQSPEAVSSPSLIRANTQLAESLGIDTNWLISEDAVAALAGNQLVDGSEPIATVYAGHQFGNWNPQLGDGRAVLLGEIMTPSSQRFDIQLKGSGPTPYSRGGDGRAPIGPVIREFIVSEAMHALGIATSRSLAAVATGDSVMRETVMPGAVLTRVASSHIRFGTFQFFASRGDQPALKALSDYVIDRHYPEIKESENPYLSFFQQVIRKTAQLVASWQQIGFIHGVMNTDNMLICGETIDYGPCAFLDRYHPETVFSSIDVGGRYAYQNQPGIAHWNLAALAQCLTGLIDTDEEHAVELAKNELDQFPEIFYEDHRAGMAKKLGLPKADDQSDELVRDLLGLMAEHEMDYTKTFTALTRASSEQATNLPDVLAPWASRWLSHLACVEDAGALMKSVNPVIIPRNHKIEEAIQAAITGDLSVFHKMTEALQTPFDETWLESEYAQSPTKEQQVEKTFCGT